MNSTVSGVEIRQAIKAVIATTQNPRTKELLTRALNMLDVEGYGTAATYLTHQTRRASRAATFWHRIYGAGLAILCAVLWGAVIVIVVKMLRSFVTGL